MAIQLKEHEIAVIKRILAHDLAGVEYRIFGSRAKGSAKPYSDVDIVLLSKNPIPLLTLSTLEENFSESDLPFKVDLVDWQRITPEFQDKIKSEWKEL